jgi:hypothetical protein
MKKSDRNFVVLNINKATLKCLDTETRLKYVKFFPRASRLENIYESSRAYVLKISIDLCLPRFNSFFFLLHGFFYSL